MVSIGLSGLGEPLKQIRLLIKDLHHRNQVERRYAELDLLAREVEIATKIGLRGGGNEVSPLQDLAERRTPTTIGATRSPQQLRLLSGPAPSKVSAGGVARDDRSGG